MRTLILDTALPLKNGSPQQRAADHLCRAIATQSEFQQITLDVWLTERSDRMQMHRGQRLVSALPADGTKDSFLNQAQRVLAGAAKLPDPAFALARHAERAGNLIQDISPQRVVLGDPVLASLIPWLSRQVPEIMLQSDVQSTVNWHATTAARLPAAGESRWHKRLGQVIAETAANARVLDPLPAMQFEFSDVYLSKAPSMLVPSTGFPWLDRHTLDELTAALEQLKDRLETPPEVILMGFPPDLAKKLPGALVQQSWQHLAGLAGAARCILLPWLSPGIARLAEAALSVGTPVIVDADDASLRGLAGRPGVLGVRPGKLARAIAIALNPELAAAAVHEEIAQDARKLTSNLPLLAKQAPRRVSALIGQPEVIYNSLTKMLLVRLRYRGSSQVQEVRLFSSDGFELNRLVPNESQKPQPAINLEGGAIVDKEKLDRGITLELHATDEVIESISIPAGDFTHLESEIAYLWQDGALLRGGFWTVDEHQPSAWGVGQLSHQGRVSSNRAVQLPEIGGLAVPFEVPINLQMREETLLWRWTEQSDIVLDRMIQRPYAAGRAATDRQPAPRPDILKLRDKHRGMRAWIIGNGPSVRLEDLERIPVGDVVFCFNRFYLSYGDHPVREDYVVSADTLMVKDFGQEMIDKSTGLPLFCVKPDSSPDSLGKFVLLPPNDTELPIFSMDPVRFISVGGSSVFVALQMAHYMGIRDVILYGIDYSFSMNLVRDPRYPFPVSFEDGNHFIKSYRGQKPWCPPNWRDISTGFLNARVAFELTGGRVVNATRGGRLEIFPRADFNTLV